MSAARVIRSAVASSSRQVGVRAYASTPRSHPSSTSSTAPSSAQQAHPYLSQLDADATSPSGSSTSPHVGPFPLPNSPPSSSSSSTPFDRERLIASQAQQWSKLRPGQKLGVAARQTSSFFVVVAGAGLCSLVVWAVGSELWSENSPTRVFEDAVDRVKDDPELRTMLIGPLTFYGSPSSGPASASRMRRNRRIAHSHTTDPTTGAETLFVRFYVQGQPDPVRLGRDGDDDDATRFGREGSVVAMVTTKAGVWWDEATDLAKKWLGPLAWADSNHPDKYHPHLKADDRVRERERVELERIRIEEERRVRASWTAWVGHGVSTFLGGAVGGLSKSVYGGTRREGESGSGSGRGLFRRAKRPRLGEFEEGEVVAELQKVPGSKQFVYKQLFVAIPDTATPNYYRHDIATDVKVSNDVQEPDRLRVVQRSRTVVA